MSNNKEFFITNYLELVHPRPSRTEAEMMWFEYNVGEMSESQVNTFLTVFCTK